MAKSETFSSEEIYEEALVKKRWPPGLGRSERLVGRMFSYIAHMKMSVGPIP